MERVTVSRGYVTGGNVPWSVCTRANRVKLVGISNELLFVDVWSPSMDRGSVEV